MRADLWLVEAGYFRSRSMAQAAIAEGKIILDGKPLRRPAEQVGEGEHTVEVRDPMPYVSRGGLKLAGALDAFPIDVTGLRAIDIGASTGGFTDVLLRRGAAHVTALDAGEGQLHESLRADPRVLCLEHCNARALGDAPLQPPYDIAVMDVSFISQTYILPGLAQILADSGRAVTLIKPQFEAGREAIGRGGLVRREADRLAAILRVLGCAAEHGLRWDGLIRSPIDGGDGNHEYLACFTRTQAPCISPDSADIRRTLAGTTL
ncbi:MAG: TlyA family RNA methyltransferase [Clostridia bacterium]|nr:TlyA family RNA methyltransferase [Clostridia bacterium]